MAKKPKKEPKPPKAPKPPKPPAGFPDYVIGMSDNSPQAVVREVDGQLVLDDPAALGVIAAVEAHNRGVAKQNCRLVYDLNADRVEHFKRRIGELGKSPRDVVIVLIHVDDVHGRDLAESLMPGADWQPYRDRGERPYARGLADRQSMQNCVRFIDPQVADLMESIKGIVVVVVDHGTAEVYEP